MRTKITNFFNIICLPFLLICLIAKPILAHQLTVQEIKFLCSDFGSATASGEDTDFTLTEGSLRVEWQQGNLKIFEGDTLRLSSPGFTFISYQECLVSLLELRAKPNIPKYSGEISYTYGNSKAFLDFLDSNLGKVVFLELNMTYYFGIDDNYLVNEMCNSNVNIWDDGLTDAVFTLPIGMEGESSPSKLTCSERRISFSGKDFSISSGGPGTHWYNLTGFFRIAAGSGRWPYTQLSALEASADMWSRATANE